MGKEDDVACGSGTRGAVGLWLRAIVQTLWQDVCKEAFFVIVFALLFIIPFGAIVAALSGVSLVLSWLFGWEFEATLASLLLFGFLAAASGVLGFEFWERVKQRANATPTHGDRQ